MKYFKLQEHRAPDKWKCEICGKIIYGTRNTIHLGVISHINAEWRRGLRKEPYDPYGHLKNKTIRKNQRGIL